MCNWFRDIMPIYSLRSQPFQHLMDAEPRMNWNQVSEANETNGDINSKARNLII
jgi:hypothetical protein